MGLNGTLAPEGSLMGYAEFQSPVGTYQEFGTRFCPLPNEQVTVHFKWQVISRFYGSCAAGVSNWINMRLDRQEGNEQYWYSGWDVVCPLLVDQGWGRATGWQDASVTLTAPATDHPDQELLTFSVGGWDYDGWWGLVDDIRVE